MKTAKRFKSRCRKSFWLTRNLWRTPGKPPAYPATPRSKKNKLLRPIHRA